MPFFRTSVVAIELPFAVPLSANNRRGLYGTNIE
jgi:hypothetical protein